MSIQNKNIFITGGAGFLGTNITQRLIEKNKITVYDNLKRNALKFTRLEKHKNFQFIKADIRNQSALSEAIGHVDMVIHLAAIAGVSNYSKYPVNTIDVNFLGTKNILDAVTSSSIKKFINFSTSEVYGSEAKEVAETDCTPIGPANEARWTYGVSKLASEHLCLSYYKENNLPVVSIRPFNIYGPNQVGEGAVRNFIKKALQNKNITIYGDGSQIRSWCYIDDLVDAVVLCMQKEGSIGNIFNIGNNYQAISTYELARKVIKLCNSRSRIVYKKHPSTDINIRIPNIDKAKKKLLFKPKVDLDTGIQRTIDWYRKNY
jgi:dTDP-glucose 4,6-dehydratase